MMFWRHEIHVTAGFEPCVNSRIEEKRPLYVKTDDQIHFVSFAPYFANAAVDTVCKEGLSHKITVVIKIQIPRGNLTELLRDAGDSTYSSILRVSAQELVTRQKLVESFGAALQTFTHSAGFFDLANQDAVRQSLHQKISSECEKARLSGEVIACEVTPIIPQTELLAQLAARAGIKETITAEKTRTREYADINLGKIVEYFLEILRQNELLQTEVERAKSERELSKLKDQEQIEQVRTDVKIVSMEQARRLETREAELRLEDAKRQQDLQKLNFEVKETAAGYEFAYKTKRQEEEMRLSQQAVELVKVREQEAASLREQKKLDAQVDLERERELSRIRTDEKAKVIEQLGSVIEKLKAIPVPDYKGVQTLITGVGSGGVGSSDLATGLALGLLSRAAQELGINLSASKSRD